MVLTAGTAIEHETVSDHSSGGLIVNFGFSGRCPLKNRCRDHCALIKTLPQMTDMSPDERDAAHEELLDAGLAIRHAVGCEWEVFSEPEPFARLLRNYHNRPHDRRPQQIGAITSGLHFHRMPSLPDHPLTWVLVSLGSSPDTNWRGQDVYEPAWKGLLHVRDTGGAMFVGASCVLDNHTLDSHIALAQRLLDANIRYMGIGPYLDAGNGHLVSTMSDCDLLRAYDKMNTDLSSLANRSDFTVMFELPASAFRKITGIDPYTVPSTAWRIEHPVVGSPVVVATINPHPGRWLRLRVDGQIIDKAQLETVGVTEGIYGRYAPGKLIKIIRSAETAAKSNRFWNDSEFRTEVAA